MREGHLQVDLRELGLAVGAQIFVAEAAGDLEVLVEAGDHQDLLEELRRLRQRVELAGMHAAGDEVVARAFGRGARHEGRFDFEEALRVEVVADGERRRCGAARCWPASRGGADRCSGTSGAPLRWRCSVSEGEKGSGLQSLRMRSSSATTSTSPVGMFLLMVSASRSLTCR